MPWLPPPRNHSHIFLLAIFFALSVTTAAIAQQTPAPFVPKGINFPLGMATATGAGGRPSIAFDGTNFLMVYRGDDGAAWAKRVSTSGVVLDTSGIKIGTNPGTIREASVVFDGANYMVVWELDIEPSEIYAARVTPQGTVLDSPEIQVTTGADAYPRPVATTFDGDNFLLVWRTSGGSFPRFAMRGLRMSKLGVSLDGPTGFPIYTGPAAYVSTAYDPVHQVHLAVWQDRSKGPWYGTPALTDDTDITGMRVSKAGTVLDAQPILISTELSESGVQAATVNQGSAGVAFDGNNFLVVWGDARPDPSIDEQRTVYGARVGADGTVLDQPAFPIGDNYSNKDATMTPVVCDSTDCLVIWMYEASRGYGAGYGYGGGIYTKRVSTSGQVYDRGIAASTHIGAGFFPFAGLGSGQVLVAWGDQRNGAPASFYAQIMERGAGPAPPALQPSGDNQPTSFSYSGFNGGSDFVSGLSGSDERHLFAVTISGDAAATSLYRYQGNGWLIDQQQRIAGNRLFALSSTAPDLVWAGGQNDVNLYKVPLGGGWFFCCNISTTLGVQVFGTPRYAPSGIHVFMVGTRGLRQHFTIHPENYSFSNSYAILGEQTYENSAPELDLGAVWGSSPTNVYAVGEFGTVEHFDGTSWTILANTPTLEALNAVWGTGSHVFAAGDFGTVIHWDGTSWSVMETGTAEHLYGIWGFDASDIYAVGTHFSVFHYDGTAWHRLLGGNTRLLLREVWGAGNRVYVAGEGGQLLYLTVPGYNPTPGLDQISPTSTPAGGNAFQLNVKGESFQANSVVRWNGADMVTTYTDSGQLWGQVTQQHLATPGEVAITVFTPGPGGGTSQTLPLNVQAQPQISFPGSYNFGDVVMGASSPAHTFTITSIGTAPLLLTSIGSSGDFVQTNDCPSTLGINASCSVSVKFVPVNSGPRSGSIFINDNSPGAPHTIALAGAGVVASLQIAPGSRDFGSVNLSTSGSPQSFTVTNNGTAGVSITQIFATGDFSQTNDCPGQLTPGQNCSVNVTFTPSALGSRAGQLYVSHNAVGSPAPAGLSGTGINGPLPELSLSTANLNFPAVLVGLIGSPLPLTLSNTGAADLHVYGIFAGSEWVISTCGQTIAPGSNCTVFVYSRPADVGPRNGTLTILSNAPSSPHSVNLGGNGASLAMSRPPRPSRIALGGSVTDLVWLARRSDTPTGDHSQLPALPRLMFLLPAAATPVIADEDEHRDEKKARAKEAPTTQ